MLFGSFRCRVVFFDKNSDKSSDETTFRCLWELRLLFLVVQGVSNNSCPYFNGDLTHWGRVTHICVGELTIIGSDNGLSPGRRQAIIWTNAGILLIESIGTNFSEILIGIKIFSFTKMGLKMSSAKWRPFCRGLNVLTILSSKSGNCRIITSHNFISIQLLNHVLKQC